MTRPSVFAGVTDPEAICAMSAGGRLCPNEPAYTVLVGCKHEHGGRQGVCEAHIELVRAASGVGLSCHVCGHPSFIREVPRR